MTGRDARGQGPDVVEAPVSGVGASGNPPALEQVFTEHAAFVWRALIHFGLDATTAEDAVQDVFLVVNRRLLDFDPARPVRPWLWGIARRVARDVRRGARRYQQRLAVVSSPPPVNTPEDKAVAAEARTFVDRFLASLPNKKRDVFFLCEIEDATAPEAAAALGIKLNTVYSRLRSARSAWEDALARREATRARKGIQS